MSGPTRPLLRWHGGKWLLAPWIIAHFAPHRVYVEPYGGAWSVGMRKARADAEVWNDLDGELVNLFSILRDDASGARLLAHLSLTPFARAEFDRAYEPSDDPVERARRMLVRSFMGHASDGASGIYRTGFRANSNRSGSTPAVDWGNFPKALPGIIERLRGVVIECRPAMAVMAAHDSPRTLHYVDPPYLFDTRTRAKRRPDNGGVYRHELTKGDHRELLAFLTTLKGMVVLSGYPSSLYDDALSGWVRVDRAALADGALARTEVLWLNAQATAAMPQPDLLARVA